MKELKRLFTRKMIHRRVFSSLMAMMLMITSVIHPINMVPAYATSNWLEVNYQKQAKNDIELYVQAESASFEPGETITLDLFVQNNSSEEYTDFGISFKDNEDAFAEAEFILTDDCGEAYITEKGSVTNLYLAPGETKALQFEGTLYGGLDVLNRKEITFLCGGYDVNGEAVTTKTEFSFTVGLFNELSIDFTDGTELIPDENNTLEITIGFNDIGYYYDTDVATDSDAKVNTDSNADLATDSDADLATDSDADYVFDLTNVTLDLETVGVKFEKVKLEEASINEENGTITALVSYKVDEDAEAGEYFGTVAANVKNGKKVYQAQTGFQFEVEDVTDSTFKKYGLFTAELANFTVNVQVPKGAFDEKVELSVTELATDSEEYKEAEEAMANHDHQYDGMMALDICFLNEDGEEVEPKEGYNVQVSIEMNADLLPQGAIDSSLMVHHLEETSTDSNAKEIIVEDVADAQTTTEGTIEVKEDVVEAKFEVDNFSTYAVTYALARATGVTGVPVNATVKLFNYDATTVNNTALGNRGFKFYHENPYGTPNNDPGIVDNTGTDTNQRKGTYEYEDQIPMTGVLSDNGYPQTRLTANNENLDLEYLFNDTYLKGTMKNGGYLFQKDENGYFEYDSLKNAAWYDASQNEFVLYDYVVRPGYVNSSSGYTYYGQEKTLGNFLPFNEAGTGFVKTTTVHPSTNSTPSKDAYVLTNKTDLWFGMMVEFDFYMPADGEVNEEAMVFEFEGDDDVFVYIDDQLVLDIGGVHGAENGTINFKTGTATDLHNGTRRFSQIFESSALENGTFKEYTTHKLRFFYLERGGTLSYCKLRFNMPTLPAESLTVGKTLITAEGTTNNDVLDFVKDSLTYKFRVLKLDDSGNVTEELFVNGGTSFEILDSEGNVLYDNEGNPLTGVVGDDGYFELKADQQARFSDMMSLGGKGDYVVEEILPEELRGQYQDVVYSVSGSEGTIISGNHDTEQKFYTFKTPALSPDVAQLVGFTNEVDISKVGIMKVSKTIAPGSMIDENQVFTIEVKLGDSLLPVGAKYKVGSDERIVTEAGQLQLKGGETADILTGVLSGTEFEVVELEADNYRVKYTGTITTDGESTDIVESTNKASGTFALESTVSVNVQNADYDFAVEIPISKRTEGFDAEVTNTFEFEIVPCDSNGTEIGDAYVGETITLTGNATKKGSITVGYKTGIVANGIYYYKISEKLPTLVDDMIDYDSSLYIVGIEVNNGNASIHSVKKNDTSIVVDENLDLEFINIYDNTTSVTVRKIVTGNMGQKERMFSFTATLTDTSGNPLNIFNGINGSKTNVKTFELSNNSEPITIDDLPVGAKLIIEEEDVSRDHYETSYQIGTSKSENGRQALIPTLSKDSLTVVFTNTKNAIPDTGITMDTLPYILIMLAVIGGIAFTIIRKRKDDELD